MDPVAFDILAGSVEHPAQLRKAWANVARFVLENRLWDSGSLAVRRVRWSDGERARAEDSKCFKKAGLYLWGAENRPLYLGMTTKSYRQRFGRYIWDRRSQCRLAIDYADHLRIQGMNGFPEEIQRQCSSVRRQGAVRFATEGIDDVWFALLPPVLSDLSKIRPLEKALIPVANEWNTSRGLAPLLNIEANRLRSRLKD